MYLWGKGTIINNLKILQKYLQHFSKILQDSVKLLYSTLKDPSLPLYECEELLSALSGRIPVQV